MRYYLDTEFIEYPSTIDLVSIGIVAQDGSEFYAVNSECDRDKANDFVKTKVFPNLAHPGPDPDARGEQLTLGTVTLELPRVEIAKKVIEFVRPTAPDTRRVEFYGYFSDYDWVVFCWLFGRMVDLPTGFPFYCRDLKQTVDEVHATHGLDIRKGMLDPNPEHNSLVDARWNRVLHERLLYVLAQPR